jgi:hypothetical protein
LDPHWPIATSTVAWWGWAGVRIAGLGGIFRGQIWHAPGPPRYPSADAFIAQSGKGNRWRGGLPRKHRSSIFPIDVPFADVSAALLATLRYAK